MARALSESSATLLATEHVTSLIPAVADQISRLGIAGGWLSRFVDPERPAATARLLLGYDDAALEGTRPDVPFPSEELIPTAIRPMDRRLAVAVEPLFVNDQQLGFLVLELGPREGIIYESLAEQVSSALERTRLLELIPGVSKGQSP